jgi:AGCS family alanine or glycine:cation symporter
MYFIVEGLGKNWKPLAVFFSACAMIGALPIFNVNQLTQAVNDIMLTPNGIEVTLMTKLVFGIFLVIVTSVVILGGLKRIGQVTSKLVPSMVLLYFISVMIILIVHIDVVPEYLKLIFTDAFSAENTKLDSFFGGAVGALIVYGVQRGAFSNEAGIGTAPMAHGAAKTDEPVREGLVAMLGPFIDTIVVCTLTALAILVTGVWQTSDANGVSLTATAFASAIPTYGKYLLMICVAIFSISSLFSYSYYGTKSLSFLVGAKYKHFYNYFFIASILLGATQELETIIGIIDSTFALMAIPTMLATVILAPKVLRETKVYIQKLKDERN